LKEANRMTRSRIHSLTALSLVLGAIGFGARATSADDKAVLRLRAFAVNLNSTARGSAATTYDINIERWSTPEEAARLRDILTEKGEDALLEAVQKLPRMGSIARTGHLGWDIRFAQQIPAAGGGRRIVIATDRPMSFWEAANQPRSADYAFTLAEVRLGPDGKGEGKLVPAAKIDYDQESKTLEIENYNTEPVRLTQVQVVK
jgi:hypothetical protein